MSTLSSIIDLLPCNISGHCSSRTIVLEMSLVTPSQSTAGSAVWGFVSLPRARSIGHWLPKNLLYTMSLAHHPTSVVYMGFDMWVEDLLLRQDVKYDRR